MDIFIALYIFILAAITAYEITSKSPISSHMPLLSATNIINGVVLIGAMIVMANAETTIHMAIAFIAIALAAANAVGGLLITSRIISVFSKNKAGGE